MSAPNDLAARILARGGLVYASDINECLRPDEPRVSIGEAITARHLEALAARGVKIRVYSPYGYSGDDRARTTLKTKSY